MPDPHDLKRAGIEATNRELQNVFQKNGITRVAAMGMPLDPNQHQAMIESPSRLGSIRSTTSAS